MDLTLSVIRYQNRTPDQPVSAHVGDSGGTIGRSPDNNLVLPDPDRWVSGHHAEIRFRDGRFFLTDTSTNGTYVNHAAEPVPDGQEIELHDGDEVSIGAYDVRVSIAVSMPRPAAPFAGFGQAEPKQAPPFGHTPPESPPDVLDLVREKPGILGPAPPSSGERDMPPLDLDDWMRPSPQEPEPDHIAPRPTPGRRAELPAEPDHTPEEEVFFTPPNAIPDNYDIWSDEAKPAAEPAPPESTELPPEEPEPPLADVSPVPEPARPRTPPAPGTPREPPAEVPQAQEEYLTALTAFFTGLGTGELPASAEARAELMRTAGLLLRTVTQGLMTVLMTRASFKSELRLEMTTIRSADNNPYKFSVDVDDALGRLLLRQSRGFLPPIEATREAFDDIQAHEMAMIAGLRAALGALLARFDPADLERRFSKQSVLDNLVPMAKKAKYWDLFTEVYSEVAKDAAEGFLSLFRDEFNRAYEAQSARLKAGRQKRRS
ncbi:MAG: type VI secretion system-associated FHA domain protein TagH [Chromatiaceae bacterium]